MATTGGIKTLWKTYLTAGRILGRQLTSIVIENLIKDDAHRSVVKSVTSTWVQENNECEQQSQI